MSITGEPGRGPMRVGIPVADLTAGIFAAMGILIALLEREQSGAGAVGEKLVAGGADFDAGFPGGALDHCEGGAGTGGQQSSDQHPDRGVRDRRRPYQHRRGSGDDIYRRMCKAMGANHLAADPLFATGRSRSENRDALNEAISAISRGKTSAEWIEALNAAGVPSGPIYSMDQVFGDAGVRHLAMTRTVPHAVLGEVEVIGQPIELSRTPWSIRSATPEPGEHTDAVLAELGYSAEEIAGLRASRVV